MANDRAQVTGAVARTVHLLVLRLISFARVATLTLSPDIKFASKSKSLSGSESESKPDSDPDFDFDASPATSVLLLFLAEQGSVTGQQILERVDQKE
jgi:hypothetical protein